MVVNLSLSKTKFKFGFSYIKWDSIMINYKKQFFCDYMIYF